jgi:outer membrane protein assembly factor BamE (lipoprotein component of BamABCDE complex)
MRPHRARLGFIVGGVVSSVLIFLPACHTPTTNLVNSYSERLAPIVGRGTKDDVARAFGIPTTKQTLGHTDVWEYRSSKGLQRGTNAITGTSVSRELFEKLTVMFDEAGVLRSWSIETQDGIVGRG